MWSGRCDASDTLEHLFAVALLDHPGEELEDSLDAAVTFAPSDEVAIDRPSSPALPAAAQTEEAREELAHLSEEYLRIYDAFIAELGRLDEAHVLHDIYLAGDMKIVKDLLGTVQAAARKA